MDNQDSVAKRLGLQNTDKGYELNRKSLLESIGGPLGIAEAVLPATLFSLAYAFTRDALTAVMLAAGSSVIFILVRLIQRKALTQALVGALAIALAAFLALREGGQAADYFVPGFITNASYGSVMLVSVLIGRPIMGYIAQLLFGLKDWRKDKPTYRRLRLVTLIWVGFFAARLSVQLPLYFAGLVEALALSRAIMGAPAYAGLLALTWVLLRKIATR
jgi:intracellular septation protein A